MSDFISLDEMIVEFIKSFLRSKYHRHIVYIHNSSNFDLVFLLKYLVKIVDVQPVIHNGRIISLMINFGKNLEYKIQFKDSYLLLLNSLYKLTKGFGVDTLKSVFPFLFVNKDNLLYVGQKPDIKFYNKDIDLSVYNSIPSGQWDLRAETLKYLGKDLNSLLEILCKFQTHL